MCFLGSSFYFINNLGSGAVFSTMGSGLLWGQGQGIGQSRSSLKLVILRRLWGYQVLELYSQLWGQVSHGVRVRVQVYYGVRVQVQVRAVVLAAGDPKGTIGLTGSEAVFSAMGSGLLLGQGSDSGLLQGPGQGMGQGRASCSG